MMSRPRFLLLLLAATTMATCTMAFGQPKQYSPREESSPVIKLDHLFIYAPAQSSEAEVISELEAAGFYVATSRHEFSDGVISRYVFFYNGYLEVLWYDGGKETDDNTRRQAGWERTGASPFGVGLRRREGTPEDLPFPTRRYTAEWMEPGTALQLLGTEADTLAPELFVLNPQRALPDSTALMAHLSRLHHEEAERYIKARAHPLGVRQITHARLTVLPGGDSEAALMLNRSGVISLEVGQKPLLEIFFDRGERGLSQDLRPLLPLLFRY